MIQLHFSFSSRFRAERLAKFEVKVFKNDYILSIQCIEYTGFMQDQSIIIICKYYLIFFDKLLYKIVISILFQIQVSTVKLSCYSRNLVCLHCPFNQTA